MLQNPAFTTMSPSPEPADSENAMSKKPRLTEEEPPRVGGEDGKVTGTKLNGFEKLGLMGNSGGGFLMGSLSRESDGKFEGSVGSEEQGEAIGASEGKKEMEELGFDLNFPASEVAKEGSAQLGHRDRGSRRTIIDLEAENGCGEEKEELGFGCGGNGDLGFGLGNVKGESFGQGVSSLSMMRRSSSREDKGKEKVDDGDWLQLCTGSKLRAPAASRHSSDDRRSDSLSFGWK